jgi:hypothetical protein
VAELADDVQRKEEFDMGCHSVRKQVLRIGILACTVAAGLSGCASSGLVNVWMDPQYAANPMKNVLVVAMKPDADGRHLWEDAFADAFRQRGVTATPSHQLFPNDLPDTNGIIAAVRENSYDGFIVTVELPSDTLTQYVPGRTIGSVVAYRHYWGNSYYTYYNQVYRPAYTAIDRYARHRIEVWSTTGEGALVWTATSKVPDPTSRKALKQRIIGEVIDDLAKDGVIPTKK